MEKIKKIRPQDMAMEQIQWYIQENQRLHLAFVANSGKLIVPLSIQLFNN